MVWYGMAWRGIKGKREGMGGSMREEQFEIDDKSIYRHEGSTVVQRIDTQAKRLYH